MLKCIIQLVDKFKLDAMFLFVIITTCLHLNFILQYYVKGISRFYEILFTVFEFIRFVVLK